MDQKTVSCFLSLSSKSSVWAQVLHVLCCWDVSIGEDLECGGKILLVIGVVYAILQLVFRSAVDCAFGSEREEGVRRDLVEVLGSIGPVSKAVQVLCLCLVRRDGGKDAARSARMLVDGIHHVGDSVLVNVVCRKVRDVTGDVSHYV